ncbi:hypothetical protein MSG28_000966 [Choristoneura fumiferana]|uniref:Uncharacterized protein n=1 Tax=Choristoneura fumiferana TaxID=7141 RepID=A0ACC0K2U6_CHOFU|nr:hypothetical protein MSG28_000966 [Choristoneura fumiferana]
MANQPQTPKGHPRDPHSNVPKFGGYDPNNYMLDGVNLTVLTDESLTPGRPPLPAAVIDQMVKRDKAFWVDKPGANAYTMHDAHRDYAMTTEMIKPTHQDVFPRSYQYDLDCVRYRRLHGCDGLKQAKDEPKKPLKAYCRDCRHADQPGLTPFQLAWAQDPGQRRWRYYPDLTANLTAEEIRESMDEVGRPYQNEACNWYYKNYPSVKYDCIVRKFGK